MTVEIDTTLSLYDTAERIAPVLFENGDALPPGRRQALMAALTPPSAVDRIERAMEAVYGALKDGGDVPQAALVMAAQCAHRMATGGYHWPDRADQIYQVCRRALGLTESAETPDPDTDPEPRPLPLPPAP